VDGGQRAVGTKCNDRVLCKGGRACEAAYPFQQGEHRRCGQMNMEEYRGEVEKRTQVDKKCRGSGGKIGRREDPTSESANFLSVKGKKRD